MSSVKRSGSTNSRKRKACITCTRQPKHCGLCDACYQAAVRLIRAGKVSRQELEDQGLILPSRQGGLDKSPFRNAAGRKLGREV